LTPTGRNEPCPCGSGKKYKQCCLAKDEQKAREALAKAVAEAPEKPAESAEGSHAERPKKRQDTYQPWKSGAQNTRGFNKVSVPRKVGSG
jgi:hypothetical protein